MSYELIIGVGIVVSLLLFLAFNIDEEHVFLKNMLIIFSFGLLIIIPANLDNIAFIKAYKWVYVVFVAYMIVYLFVKSSYMMALVNPRRSRK